MTKKDRNAGLKEKKVGNGHCGRPSLKDDWKFIHQLQKDRNYQNS